MCFLFGGHHRPETVAQEIHPKGGSYRGISCEHTNSRKGGIVPRDYRSACIINAIDLLMMLLLVPFKKDQRH